MYVRLYVCMYSCMHACVYIMLVCNACKVYRDRESGRFLVSMSILGMTNVLFWMVGRSKGVGGGGVGVAHWSHEKH